MAWRHFTKKLKGNDAVRAEIHPDEIFLDSHNLHEFDTHQLEGRIERPIGRKTLVFLGVCFLLVGVGFTIRAWNLQVTKGEVFAQESEDNRLRHELIFAPRGVIFDRNGKALVSNMYEEAEQEFAKRSYADFKGLAHVVGYVKYPAKDSAGFYWNDGYEGKDGVEKEYESILSGENGLKIIETNALSKPTSENVIKKPAPGIDLALSIDADLNDAFYRTMSDLAREKGFSGGGALVMDIESGEMISMVSFPEYDPAVLSDGKDAAAISGFLSNPSNPFLNRVVDGLYTPGSIVKPFMAIAALEENVIHPSKEILSTGSISLPNKYDPSLSTIFRDWKAHGLVDMREAIAVSSDVYFYEIGGGYKDQRGLGITLIEKYMKMFGFGQSLAQGFFKGDSGVIPNPAWKRENFDGEEWYVGNTYHTSIGQYGFQVTPIQALMAVSALANDGIIVHPTIIKGEKGERGETLPLDEKNFKIAKEGMRMSVTEGIAGILNIPQVSIAAKTGTAELGSLKQYVNSWIVGFWPYEKPKYAFAVVMEKGPHENTVGAAYVTRGFFNWLIENKPEYLK